MKKTHLLFGIAMLFSIFAVSLSSAYYAGGYGSNYYDNYQFYSSRSSGYYGGPSYGSSTSYQRTNSMQYLGGGGYEQTVHTVKTTTVSPRNYGYRYYGGYNYYPMNYYSYRPYSGYSRSYYSYPYDGSAVLYGY